MRIRDVIGMFGLDEIEARYFTNMAIKSFTDPTAFHSFDDEGNSLLMYDENGHPMRDENGNYMFYPGGTVLGSIINHGNTDNRRGWWGSAWRCWPCWLSSPSPAGARKGARTARRTAWANPLPDLHFPMKKASEKEAVLLVAGAGFEPTTFGL